MMPTGPRIRLEDLLLKVVLVLLSTSSMALQDNGGDQGSLVRTWLSTYNDELEILKRTSAAALWETLVHPSTQTTNRLLEAQAAMAEWLRVRVEEADRVRPWAAARDERRMLHLISQGPRYTAPQARSFSALVSRMRNLYSSVVLTRGQVTYRGERDVTRLMRTSRDPQLLLWAWQAWHDALGPPIRPLFVRAVALMNQAARRGGYNDMGAAWRSELEFGRDVDVWAAVERVYDQVAPLYALLHAHVRAALAGQYGKELVDPAKSIPAHLLGDLWSQDWSSLLELLLPGDNATVNTTSESVNLTTRDVVKKEAEGFFQGLGFPPLPDKFWQESVLGEEESTAPGCHPRSMDMFAPGDYRMMLCGAAGEENLPAEAFHELGHVHYFQAYSSQPTVFRTGANAAFHETIGDTIYLAAASHKSTSRWELRWLLKVALSKLPLLAFARVLDEWRWAVFRGTVQEGEYNEAWWLLKGRYQGVAPPSPRSEQYFDPAAKFHVPDNMPYIRYLVAVVAQFQVHETLCEVAQGRPISAPQHACAIAGSHAAGSRLRRAMSSGSRLRWHELLEAVTGTPDLEAGPLLRYLKPLTLWLRQEARARNLTVGW